jgi:hypothetical protein
MKKEHEVMTTVELKNFLRIGYENTVRLLEDGIIPSTKINNRGDRRILREDAIAFIRGQKPSAN